MGRPKKENTMTSAQRSAKFRSNPQKRLKSNAKQREARKSLDLSEEEKIRKREAARVRKVQSRLNQSRQKIFGTQLKDRNRKREAKVVNEENENTKRSHKHRLKVAFDFRHKKKKVDNVTQVIDKTVKVLSPNSKVEALAQICSKSLSPQSKNDLSMSIGADSMIDTYRSLSKKRDDSSNVARRVLLKTAYKNVSTRISRRKLNSAYSCRWSSLVQAANQDVDQIITHYKTKRKQTKTPTETQKKINEFYNKDTVSRQLPYKKLTRRIKDHLGVYYRVAVRVMEITLKKAYATFKEENPDVKVSSRSFEMLRPKNVRLRAAAQRLQCCCTYHTNMEYVRKACGNILVINGKENIFKSNESLISAAVCNDKSLRCIFGVCMACKDFPSIDNFIDTSMKCSKSCFKDDKDCSEHRVNVKQFERVTYEHKGVDKKKIQLVDKTLLLGELIHLLKTKLANFPKHRFNVQHTNETYDQVVDSLGPNNILKIHDFSENYTCLVPEEIQSLHWTQETVTVYPIVVLRRVGVDVREDHLVFVSDDKKHDVPFVEFCNEKLQEHYRNEGVIITHDIEYNDGCASQFKCIRAFSSLARRNIKTTRIFCETSHGKSKSDGLGGVVKSYASRAVCGEKRVMRNAKELTEFFNEHLVVESAIESEKPMLNRKFFYIPSDEIIRYRESFPDETFKFIQGTLSIHEVSTTPGNSSQIMYRNSACACPSCLTGQYSICDKKEQFADFIKTITINTHSFSKSTKRKVSNNDEDDNDNNLIDLDEDEIEELESAVYIETEAAKYIEKDDIAVIKTGDDHPYYLLQLSSSPYKTTSEVQDDYGHIFPPQHRVVEGNYLEVHRNEDDRIIYYIDYKRKAMVSAFCVVGNCPSPPTTTLRKRGKDVKMYVIDNDMHQALSELVNCADF